MADVLKVAHANITDNTGAAVINGASSTTYTILSVSICEIAGNAETFSMFRTDGGASSGKRYIYFEQSIPAKATFVHNDKVVLEADDEIWITSPSASASLDVVISYLEQT
jgi:hypothetical protein